MDPLHGPNPEPRVNTPGTRQTQADAIIPFVLFLRFRFGRNVTAFFLSPAPFCNYDPVLSLPCIRRDKGTAGGEPLLPGSLGDGTGEVAADGELPMNSNPTDQSLEAPLPAEESDFDERGDGDWGTA